MSNSLGKIFVVTSFGESHGPCVGVLVNGCPAGLPLTLEDIQQEVDRRRPQAGTYATTRAEEDKVEILSGVFNGHTTGASITMLVWNRDTDDSVYEQTRFLARPGHADLTAFMKYGGFNDYRGGGQFSGRITAGFVMAGAVAKKLLQQIGVEVIAHTLEIAGIRVRPVMPARVKQKVAQNQLRCADGQAAKKMLKAIEQAAADGDSVGGIIEGIALHVPFGLGEPVFDTLDGDIAKAMLAVPAVKGVEFGAGFAAALLKGSENNDSFRVREGKIVTNSNHAGGVLGGISNGMPVVVRVAVKPTPSIGREQRTVDMQRNQPARLSVKGRHDTCIVPRVVPVVEAMLAITLSDFALRARLIPGVIR